MKSKYYFTVILILLVTVFGCEKFKYDKYDNAKVKPFKKILMGHKWQIEEWKIQPCIFHTVAIKFNTLNIHTIGENEDFEWDYLNEEEAYVFIDFYREILTQYNLPEYPYTVPVYSKKWCPESIYEFINDTICILHSSCGEQYDDTISWEMIGNGGIIFKVKFNYYIEDTIKNEVYDSFSRWAIKEYSKERISLIHNDASIKRVLVFKAVEE
jgi:hypothetical protein